MTKEGSYPPDHPEGPSSKVGAPTPVGKVRPVLTVVPDDSALGQFLGSSAVLSAPVITRLTETWKSEQPAFVD
jgi:hypothetical protein